MNEQKQLKEFFIIIVPGILLFFTSFSLLIYSGFWLERNAIEVEGTEVNQELKQLFSSYREVCAEIYVIQCMPEEDVIFKEKSKSCQINLLQKQVNQLAIEYNDKSKRYHAFLNGDSLPVHLKLYQFKKL